MKLSEQSLKWSIQHLFKESDNDLFPRPFELEVIKQLEADVIAHCKDIDLGITHGIQLVGS